MPDVYSIAQWDRYYENNRSRIIKTLSWVPVPNGHDGENYSTLMARKDGPEIFAAWILLLQVASRCDPRGSLNRANGEPHTPATISLKTRAPLPLFEKAMPFLASFGWLSRKSVDTNDTALACHDSAAQVPPERHRREGKGIEGRKEEPLSDPVSAAWNAASPPLPKCLSVSSKRKAAIGARLRDSFFADNYPAAVQRAAASSFCLGENNRGWKMDFEFFIKPDSVAKIMEGKYDNSKGSSGERNGRAFESRNDYSQLG